MLQGSLQSHAISGQRKYISEAHAACRLLVRLYLTLYHKSGTAAESSVIEELSLPGFPEYYGLVLVGTSGLQGACSGDQGSKWAVELVPGQSKVSVNRAARSG
jgi:hypothetical protein